MLVKPNDQSMAAKADLLRVLGDQTLTTDEKVRECTATARRHQWVLPARGILPKTDMTTKELPDTDVEGLVKHPVARRGEKDVEAFKNADDHDRKADEKGVG